MGQSLGITSSVNQAPALSASEASTYVRFKDKYDREKRVQCHIQATNKFPSKLGLIIERAETTAAKKSGGAGDTHLKTISNPK